MNCPSCQTTLTREMSNGIVLDVCPKCGGIWFDEGELGKFLKYGPAEAEIFSAHFEAEGAMKAEPQTLSHLARICPSCGENLTTMKYQYSSNVVIDSCQNCGGVFVDQGEVVDMANYNESSRSQMPKAEAAGLVAKMEMDANRKMERAKFFAASMAAHKDALADVGDILIHGQMRYARNRLS